MWPICIYDVVHLVITLSLPLVLFFFPSLSLISSFLFAAPHGLNNAANLLCNIYVFISDPCFQCIKRLAHKLILWHCTSLTFPPFELIGLERVYCLFAGAGFCCIIHYNTNVITYISNK